MFLLPHKKVLFCHIEIFKIYLILAHRFCLDLEIKI